MIQKLLFVGLLFATHFMYSQETIPASGGEATGSGGTVSYTVGQLVYNTYADATGSVAQGIQQPYELLTLNDDEAPEISGCPTDISQRNDAGVCTAVVTWTEPTAYDNFDGTISYFSSSHAPGDVFNIGDTEVTYVFKDAAGNEATCKFNVKITNTLPSAANGITAPDGPVQAGTLFNLSADFNDDNLTSAIWYFSSDGEINTPADAEYNFPETVSGGTVSKDFNFGSDMTGVYTVKVVVTDTCGETAEADYNYVVIFDPNGGFVTGGGWIWSPFGALSTNTNAEGIANFGFFAKYKTGKNNATEVDGNTTFQFKEGDFNFKSASHDNMSLVISGERKATYKGIGTVNGYGSYKFMVTVIDGEAPGAGPDDYDSFRIKVWDNTNTVVYDNEIGKAENADASNALGGGSIVIHKPKGKGNNAAKTSDSKAEDLNDGFNLAAYPNPTSDYIVLDLKDSNLTGVTYTMYDLQGRTVTKGQVQQKQTQITMQSLATGVYILKVNQNNNQLEIFRIIKK